jgi:surfactin synthase thioesterase subunit/glycosyltransferase involved in cell wall biosynthesis
MRILLAQNSLYYPAHGGGDRSNRLLIEALAARGHACRVIARIGSFGEAAHQAYLQELAAHGVVVLAAADGAVTFRLNGVEVHIVTSHRNLRAYFTEQAAQFAPDIILASTDDPAQVLFDAALKTETARVVYLARATLALPFGPDCAFPSVPKTEALRRADALVGVSNYVARYIRRWGAIDAVHVPISLMDPGPYPALGRFDNEFVTLVNPCAVKGIAIFLALAGRMPHVQFAAVPTWGTNAADRAALMALPNVRVLDPVDNVDDLLARTRVLLAPSLWAEARSRIIVEAMLRGVPVLAANVGGIPEAMMGCDYLLPVRAIEKYRPALDEQMVPLAEVPPQDIGPWFAALDTLLTDRAHYEQLSTKSRETALAYAGQLGVGPFEEVLERTLLDHAGVAGKRTAVAAGSAAPENLAEKLSPEKRRLLALRLRKLRGTEGNPWFPGADMAPHGALRLFCFPHAGGGTSAFHSWSDALPEPVAVCPVRLPGREGRTSALDPPFENMGELVAALAEAIGPYLDEPFAFYGHSMGAAVAFELSRALRACNRRLPAALFVSGARAPQFRLGHVPPPAPSEAALLEELRRLQGVPKEVLDHPDLLRMILPALAADTALYRKYVYTEAPPLDFPIRAYGGAEDPNITREHLEAWGRQTTASFALRIFPGGHFFVQTNRGEFLRALAADLSGVPR